MKWLKTAALFVILVIIAAYVYFYEIKGGEEKEKQKQAEEKILVFEPDSVQKIEIRSVFKQFEFTRSDDGWEIQKPLKTAGDKSAIDGILNSLKNMTKVREFKIKTGEQPQYGLVGRSVLVILGMKNGTRDSVRFGDATPVGNNVFAGKGDSTVFTVASYVKTGVDKDLFDWRDKSVAKVKLEDIREFRLKNPKGEFTLNKNGNDWMITSPISDKADNSTANTILRKFESGKVKSIVSETYTDPAEFRLKNPPYIVDLYIGEAKARKEVIFSDVKENTANGKDDSRPYVFTVDSTFINDLDKSLFDLRLKTIANFEQSKIDSVTIWQRDSLYIFSKDTSNSWVYDDSQKVKQWKVSSLLSYLKNLRAEKFLMDNVSNPRKYGLNNPDVIAKVYQDGKLADEIHLANPSVDQHVAYGVEAKKVIQIAKSAYNNIHVKLSDYLDKEKKGT
jgi:hypothetical protein